jgi:predicted Zn-dependent protease
VQQAREQGDPRFAGRALALLKPWADDPAAPVNVVLMLATTEQYVHEFDRAARRLEALVARDANQPQAWLTLATLRRLRGNYASSDQACNELGRQPGASVHAGACLAENQALRGQFDAARRAFTALLAQPLDAGTRGWLLTSLAELEERAGRVEPAEKAFRLALQAEPGEGYATLALADLLIANRRAPEALKLLQGQARSDAVLLRLVQAGGAETDKTELRERFAQAGMRPGAFVGHAREQAMFAWFVEGDLPAAVRHARENLATQREPIDLLLFAQVAKAAGDAGALGEAARLTKETGLHDRRIDALL